jgi:hypothetical protein
VWAVKGVAGGCTAANQSVSKDVIDAVMEDALEQAIAAWPNQLKHQPPTPFASPPPLPEPSQSPPALTSMMMLMQYIGEASAHATMAWSIDLTPVLVTPKPLAPRWHCHNLQGQPRPSPP